ncbi:thioredoxin family protein [Swingsia samuiensis]|uniref:Thiol reductase thioredoxin n=1 Tax=Swingsia samuiensis TaxID=1293412 RepID=A0A4Y6UIV9_9PROT|nr:thioredoxin family protein [Swingsia samuiensis]QDH16297.1 thiol reductase thioredoxin [Swingsia samuiensis]
MRIVYKILSLTSLFIPLSSPSYSHTIAPPTLREQSAPFVATPYPSANLAHTQVQQAFVLAAKTHRNVLLDFGGNWCPDCKMLAGVFELPDAKKWLDQNFVLVPINVEKFNTNLDIPQKYNVSITAVPTVLIITPNGHLLNQNDAETLGNARAMSPQAVINLIAEWDNRQ